MKGFLPKYLRFIGHRFIFDYSKNKNIKITTISLLTIFLSCFLAFLTLAFINYIQFRLESSFVLKSFHLSYEMTPQTENNWKQKVNSFNSQYPIKEEFFFANKEGLILNEEMKSPLDILAIEKDYIDQMPIHFVRGSFNPDIPSIIISEEVSKELNINLNDVITVIISDSQNGEKLLRQTRLKVTGIMSTISITQSFLAFLPLSYLESYFSDVSLKKGILLKDTTKINVASYDLGRYLKTPIKDFQTSNQNLIFSIKWEKVLFLFVLVLIISISFVIIYLGFNVVIERNKKSLVIFRILGMTHKQLKTLFFYKAFIIGVIGSFLGVIAVFVTYKTIFPIIFNWILLFHETDFHFYNDFFLKTPLFQIKDIFIILLFEWVALFFAVFYPFYKMRQTPLYEVLKND